MADKTLLFAYDALMDPETLSALAPDADFLFVAHYPETRLRFAAGPSGPTPTLVRDPGGIVWGAVFAVRDNQAAAITDWAAEAGRGAGLADHKAVDREGNKHDCLVLVATGDSDDDSRPDPAYVESMLRGARHWNLPAGWVIGLEDFLEP